MTSVTVKAAIFLPSVPVKAIIFLSSVPVSAIISLPLVSLKAIPFPRVSMQPLVAGIINPSCRAATAVTQILKTGPALFLVHINTEVPAGSTSTASTGAVSTSTAGLSKD